MSLSLEGLQVIDAIDRNDDFIINAPRLGIPDMAVIHPPGLKHLRGSGGRIGIRGHRRAASKQGSHCRQGPGAGNLDNADPPVTRGGGDGGNGGIIHVKIQ